MLALFMSASVFCGGVIELHANSPLGCAPGNAGHCAPVSILAYEPRIILLSLLFSQWRKLFTI